MHDAFVAKSEPMARYVARDARGRTITASELPPTIDRFGHLGVIARADLVSLLETALDGVEIRAGVSIDVLSPGR